MRDNWVTTQSIATRRNSIFLLLIILAVIILFFIVLTIWNKSKEKWIEDSIITGLPCEVPCWYGITPGITSRSNAKSALNSNPYIEQNSIDCSGTNESGVCTWRWRSNGRSTQPSFMWQNDVIDEITMGLTFDLSVSEMIIKFGKPEAVTVFEGGIPEHWYWIVKFHFPNNGIEFTAYTEEFSNEIDSSTEVSEAKLFKPMTKDKWIKYIEEKYYIEKNQIFPWYGYGNVTELYIVSVEND